MWLWVAMFWRMIADKTLTTMTSILYDTALNDMEAGDKMFRHKEVEEIELHASSERGSANLKDPTRPRPLVVQSTVAS